MKRHLLIGVGLAAIAALTAGTVALATTTTAPKQVLTVSRSALDPGNDASLLSGTGCSTAVLGKCHFRISETSGSNQPVEWSLEFVGPNNYQSTIAFSPAVGMLYPGQSVAVMATGLCSSDFDSAILVHGVGGADSNGGDTTDASIVVIGCG